MSGVLLTLFKWVPFHSYITNVTYDLLIGILKTGPLPKHVAFVMDGNRRFAKGRSLPLKDGHNAGAENLVSMLDTCYRLGINAVTIYAFSIENFNRPKLEVDVLFQLLRERLSYMSSAGGYTDKNELKIKIIGNKSLIPPDILVDLEKIEDMTKDNKKYLLNVCFPYTSRDDITHCVKKIAKNVEEHKYEISDIDEKTLTSNMYFGDEYPNIDILIRTSGHTRLSDFMLWQTNQNSVIVFDNSLWPDFRPLYFVVHLIKWSYYKTLILKEVETIELKHSKVKGVAVRDLKHPLYASVSGN